MRLLHLSDLHLGKRVNEFSMVEDQRYILRKVLEIIDEEKPDGVMIAGDIYDKSVPNFLADFYQTLQKGNCRCISSVETTTLRLNLHLRQI